MTDDLNDNNGGGSGLKLCSSMHVQFKLFVAFQS